MQKLLALDSALFRLINQRWHNDLFDWLLPVVRNSYFSIPLYLFLLIFVICNGKKNIGWWLVFAACVPILTDTVSSKLIKEHIFRLRPCNDPAMADGLRFLLSYKPQSSSFTSSHATTHFGMAVFFHATLKNFIGKWSLLFFLWAFVIVYAQVYVGVNFPGDIICGAVTGAAIGYIVAFYSNKYFSLA
jgi:membrane-associated phospholipid phosphatase